MGNTFAIGDIHGGYRALLQVLERSPIQAGDLLIFLGDYVDGWSESSKTISFLIELSAQQNCVFLKGNHDAWTEKWSETGEINNTWYNHGGESTIASYANCTTTAKAQHLQFFKSMQLYFIDAFSRCYVHGGFTSKRGPAFESISDVLLIDRTLWETALASQELSPSSIFYPKRLKAFKEIFIGHTPTLYLGTDKPAFAGNVCNIDTGAAFTGRLTTINVQSKAYWQSDCVQTLYPGEKGRNSK